MPENAPGREPEQPAKQPQVPDADPPLIPEVKYEDFLAAQRNPKIKRFLQEAKAESDELKRKGLIHL